MKGKHRRTKKRKHFQLKTKRRRQLFVLLAIMLGVTAVGVAVRGVSIEVTMEP